MAIEKIVFEDFGEAHLFRDQTTLNSIDDFNSWYSEISLKSNHRSQYSK